MPSVHSYPIRDTSSGQPPFEEECHTAREVFSSPEQKSLESPPFSTRRMAVLGVKRPGGPSSLG